MNAILASLATFVSTLSGGFFAIRHRDRLHLIASFSAGVLVGVCFFDILPEIISLSQSNGVPLTRPLTAIVVGFLTIHVLEKFALIHSSHEGEYAAHKHPWVGNIGASGLTFHSFLDGIGIGLGFHISAQIGWAVTFAVLAHDFCDGLNTATLILRHNDNRAHAIRFLVLDAAAPIAGALATYLFSVPIAILLLYLGFYFGFLLYIGAGDLLPEAHSNHNSFGMLGLTILGVILVFATTCFL